MRGKKEVRVLIVVALLIVLAGISSNIQENENVFLQSKGDAHIENGENKAGETADTQESGEVSDAEEQTATETKEEPKWPIVVRTDFDYIVAAFPAENIYCVNTGDGYRYLTQEGKELTGDFYEKAYPFHEGLACVCKDGKFGYIDLEGETALPFAYEDASPFMEGLAYFYKDGKYGFMDHTGNPQFYLDCDSVSAFVEGLAYICVDGRYGYIDKTGKTVIEPVYDDAEYFEDGFAEVVKDSKRGMIDQTGREVVKPEYFEIERVQSCFLAEKNEAYNIFDLEGNLLSEQIFSSVSWDGTEVFNEEQGISGIICQGNVYAFDTYYSSLEAIPEQRLVIAILDGYYGMINFEGEMQIPFSYRTIRYYESENVFLIENAEGKWGVLDGDDFTSWRVLCSYDYIDATDPVKGMLRVKKGEKYGIIGLNDEIVLPISYDRVEILENGAYFARKDDVSWLYDKNGTLLNQGNYDYITYVDECYEMSEGESIGYLNLDGNKVFSLNEYYYKSSNSDNEFSYPGIEILKNYVYVGEAYTYLVQTREIAEDELPECLFENRITPRAFPFWNLLQNGSFEVEDMESYSTVRCSEWKKYETFYKLYDFSHRGKPILYAYASPYDSISTYSGFFALEGEEAVCLRSAYKCGGTAGGDIVCLWYDREEGQILYGETGGPNASWVGFFDSYSTVFDYAGEFFLKSSERMVSLSPDTSEYYIDGEPVSAGEYEEQAKRFNERYKYISLEK